MAGGIRLSCKGHTYVTHRRRRPAHRSYMQHENTTTRIYYRDILALESCMVYRESDG